MIIRLELYRKSDAVLFFVKIYLKLLKKSFGIDIIYLHKNLQK